MDSRGPSHFAGRDGHRYAPDTPMTDGKRTRTLIVGDLHGCLDELEDLLASVGFDRDRDGLVSVGDLVGKGPRGADVVRFFRSHGYAAVRGNHDERLLAWRRGDDSRPLGKSHARDAERLSDDDWTWLEALPLHLALPEHDALVVHGGLVPGIPLDAQEPRVVMNLRSIRPDGSPSSRVDEGRPWAELWPGPALVVFGHDAVRGLQRWPNAVGLDTGCVYGGELTALSLPELELLSVPARRAYVAREGK